MIYVRHCQSTVTLDKGLLYLPVSDKYRISPYFRLAENLKSRQEYKLNLFLLMKAFIKSWTNFQANPGVQTFDVEAVFFDPPNDYLTEIKGDLRVDITNISDEATWWDAAEATILDYANNTKSYSMVGSDVLRLFPADPRLQSLSFANPSRTLNSSFQISSSRSATVSYAVDVACNLSLTSGQQGTVYLEYADDSGFTTNVVEVNRFVNGNTGTLTIGLNLTQNATGTLAGVIPAAKYVRLRTQNNTGSPTFTFRKAQEVLG